MMEKLSLRDYAKAMGGVITDRKRSTVVIGKKAQDPQRLKAAEDKRARKLARNKLNGWYPL